MAISFNKEINVGNLVSAAITTSFTLVAVTIFILNIQSGYKQETMELKGKIEVYSTKLEQLTTDFKQYKSENVSANAEIRQNLNQVITQIADLRVALAGVGSKDRR